MDYRAARNARAAPSPEQQFGLDLDDPLFGEGFGIDDTERFAEQALHVLSHHQQRKTEHARKRVPVIAPECATAELVCRQRLEEADDAFERDRRIHEERARQAAEIAIER